MLGKQGRVVHCMSTELTQHTRLCGTGHWLWGDQKCRNDLI
jgi:hypothetical protein